MTAPATDLRRMLHLLERERAALRQGDQASLVRTGRKMAAVLGRLEGERPLESDATIRALAAALADSARRNEGLIRAAIEGVGEAQALVARARKPRPHATYARDGRRETISDPAVSLERRA